MKNSHIEFLGFKPPHVSGCSELATSRGDLDGDGDVDINFAASFRCSCRLSRRWLGLYFCGCDFFEASAISHTKMCVTDLALTVIGAVLGPICNIFCGGVSSKMTTTLNLRSNLDDMVRDMKNLMDRITEVKQKKEAAEKEGKDIRPQVVTLLEDVEKLELKSKEVEDILEEIKRLKDNILDVVYLTTIPKAEEHLPAPLIPIPKAVEHIPGPSIPGQTTALKTLDKTMSLLYDDRYRVIGIWGLGGVGKTTLAQIAKRLLLEEKMGESTKEMAIRLHQRLVNEEKPEVHKGCKIILTSRRMEVCRSMFTDFDVKIDVLNDEEAWQLFCEKAGDVLNDDEEIKPFAEAIAKECCGLPLAIIIVGAAMRRKTRVELWDYALNELRRSVPSIEGIEAEVYKPLKWSYDSLQGNNIKSCFLYCSLFPEDYSIEIIELVQCWLGEGLIDEQQDHVHRVNTGIALIEKLKDSCLLENGYRKGYVKMHDVVRDVAIWIASSHDDGCKSLVRSGIGLREILVEDETGIQSLPRSLLQLRDLGVLNLSYCESLEGLPSLAGLSKLQILDLKCSNIIELPDGMENLRNLRQLDLYNTFELKDFQVGIISKLPRLEVLDMRDIAYYFEGNGAEEETQTTFEELRQLHRLLFLCISFNRIPHLKFEDLSWIKKLRGFQILIDPETSPDWEESTTKVKEVTIGQVDISQESVRQLCTIAESLIFFRCQGLHEKVIDLDINSICHGLKSLEFYSMKFNRSLEPNGEMASDCDLLPNLEKLKVDGLEGLESISELLGYLGLRFLSLKSINVSYCSNMKYLLSCGDFIQTLPNLEVIMVTSCYELEELFNYDSGQNMALDPIVPKLRTLKLKNLPKLRSLCRHEETWPCLEQVKVWKCEQLRRLPLSNQNAGTIKEIEGESEWWNALEWDDDETKSSLLPYFRPALDPWN
uniref:Uncharacterized protein n=1 Tax=Fagus sylvatica TaxID=28930 RepID=A0A2N9J404_FAGSY